jgi:hypothetical protein
MRDKTLIIVMFLMLVVFGAMSLHILTNKLLPAAKQEIIEILKESRCGL